jgi:hypothetical protein
VVTKARQREKLLKVTYPLRLETESGLDFTGPRFQHSTATPFNCSDERMTVTCPEAFADLAFERRPRLRAR